MQGLRVSRWRAGVLGCLLMLAAAAQAQTAATSASAQLRAFLSGTNSARGEFTQSTLGSSRDGKGFSRAGSGVFAFQRPGQFRWETIKPAEQVLIVDGKRLYFYDKDLNQATIRPWSERQLASPAAILFGTKDPATVFNLRDLPEAEGLAWLEATPKEPDSGFEAIQVGFKDKQPAQLKVKDSFGQITVIQLLAVERGIKLPAKTFDQTPEPGVDVIRQP